MQNVQQSVATLETLLNTPPSTLPLNGAAANESAVDANNSAVAPQSLPVSHLPDAMRQLMSYGHHLMVLKRDEKTRLALNLSHLRLGSRVSIARRHYSKMRRRGT